jgi:hypothetical protein
MPALSSVMHERNLTRKHVAEQVCLRSFSLIRTLSRFSKTSPVGGLCRRATFLIAYIQKVSDELELRRQTRGAYDLPVKVRAHRIGTAPVLWVRRREHGRDDWGPLSVRPPDEGGPRSPRWRLSPAAPAVGVTGSLPFTTRCQRPHPVSCKIPAMVRRPAYRLAVLLAALAFLLPLAAIAGSCTACTDCLWGAAQDCCPASCCSCCVHSPSVLTASVWVALQPAPADAMPSPQENSSPSCRSRDVFHVPKSLQL